MILVAALALLSSCEGMSVANAYVASDLATYQAIAPEYRAYVEADEKLDISSKTLRMHLLKSWEMRLEANKK